MLKAHHRNRNLLGLDRERGLAEFARYHLIQKAKAGRVTDAWIAQTETQLREVIAYLGPNRPLGSITVRDVQGFTNYLRDTPNAKGRRRTDGTIRHYLASLSNLYARAQSEGRVQPGYNPVSALMEKPVARREEAQWLEVPDAALFLEAARIYQPGADALPFMYPLVATFLLTGGRKSEVLGLELDDVSFNRGTVTFRPNKWRRLKTHTSHRTIPLWPQLEGILRAHVFSVDRPLGSLLFPSSQSSSERVVTDIRKSLDGIAELAGRQRGEIRTKIFRHTYCTARLQTTDRGAAVAPFTVSRELGHGGRAMVERVYGHLGQNRHRSEVVEYGIEQHAEVLRPTLEALRRDYPVWRDCLPL